MKDRKELLAESKDMTPVEGTVDVNIPAQVLWKSFTHANWWPRWNKCFFWAKNEDLKVGEQLVWCFQPIRPWYLYKMPAIALRDWDLSILPIFHYGQYWSTASSNIRSVYRLQARAVELTLPRTNQ